MKRISLPGLTISVLALVGPVQAVTLMLDFGLTPVIDDAGPADSRINSPYHTVNGSFTDTAWNQIQTADIASGNLVRSDNTAATGIALNIGATTTNLSTTLNLASTPSGNSALGGFTNTGVYADTSVGKDGIFTSDGTGGTRAVGFQLSGLAAGTYDIYITARNTSLGGNQTQNLYVGTSAATGNFNFSTYTTKSLTYSSSSVATGSWTEDANYVHFSVSISSGEVLNLASYGTAGAEPRGFLNSVQIVSAIPEPSTYASFTGIGVLALCIGRRLRVSRTP
ncbi:PEP-CTERM sorting domain-containing protein [Rariglobus hedericola]|uniref:PEP-CTERM sorting domain-containing protein n=2 Tax=Rariglobus hedericola TaxID=2597822 RepID=A0A556QT27_9BACT|nr:PEP-CTERM sorting domain-containing protein [Rariglobus hedericola]